MKTVRIVSFIGINFLLTMCSPVNQQQKKNYYSVIEQPKRLSPLDRRAGEMKMFAQKRGYSTRYCFLLDMRMESGLKRFFVYDFGKNKAEISGLVAHGSCDQNFLKEARFSNTPGGGCTSVGIYKVGSAYYGQYGRAYKLYGLESSNSNAFNRAIVLHSYSCVPDEECFPKPICNSSGCPMVSVAFLSKLSAIIDQSDKPILLWVYEK